MANQVWYKLREANHRLQSLRYQHSVLLNDLDQLIATLPPLLLAVHDIEDPYKSVATPIAQAAELEPPAQAGKDCPLPGDTQCPNNSGKNSSKSK